MNTPPMHRTIAHIIWDWNGTLFDDIAACVGSINRMLDRRGLAVLDYERYRNIFGFPVRDFYVQIGFDLDTEDWDTLAHEYHDTYLEMSATTQLRRGTQALLERIASRRIPMSLLSASEQSILDVLLDRTGISSFFEGVYGLANLYAVSKLDLGKRLMAEQQADPGGTLMIGDTTHDYDVASAMGCMCLLLAGGHQAEHRLAQCGCALASDLDCVASMIEDSPQLTLKSDIRNLKFEI